MLLLFFLCVEGNCFVCCVFVSIVIGRSLYFLSTLQRYGQCLDLPIGVFVNHKG